MVAIGILGDFVRKTGDTMTGDLILSGATTDLTVGGILTDSFQGLNGDVTRLLSTVLSTGITSGGVITVNPNNISVDISATTGWIYDYNPRGTIGPTNPIITYVTFPGAAGVMPASPTVTFWLIDSTGTLIQQTNFPTSAQLRTHLCVGVSGFRAGVIPNTVQFPTLTSQPGTQLIDLFSALTSFKIAGNVITANGVNLSLNTTGGPVFIAGFGYPNYQAPNLGFLTPQTPMTFRRATATTVLAPLQTTLDVANYDPNGAGVVTPVGGGANTSTITRIFAYGDPSAPDQVTVQYGQTTFATLATAAAAVGRGGYIVNPLLGGAVLLAHVCATRTATNLSDPTQATIFVASKFPTP